MKSAVYIETTVISYYTARPSRDLVVAGHQQITQEWWSRCLGRYEALVSELVIQEASQGDSEAAAARLAAIEEFAILAVTPAAEQFAEVYLRNIPLLEAATRDALHLAIASAGGMDYLVTWNCTHIARAEVRRALDRENDALGIATPTICTPEELLGE